MRVLSLLIGIGLGLLPTASSAFTWISTPSRSFASHTDVAVVGRLISYEMFDKGPYKSKVEQLVARVRGVVVVDTILWGSGTAGDSLTLQWTYWDGDGLSWERLEHHTVLWLLERDSSGIMRADHPERAITRASLTKARMEFGDASRLNERERALYRFLTSSYAERALGLRLRRSN